MCLVLQDEIKEFEDKCARLELEIGKKNSVLEGLEGRLQIMEFERLEIENEVRLRQRNQELGKGNQNGMEEDDKVKQLMIENKVLECEKRKAENEIKAWKAKYRELELRVMELEKRLSGDGKQTGLDLFKLGSLNSGLVCGFNGAAGLSLGQSETRNKASGEMGVSGSTPIKTPYKRNTDSKGFKDGQPCESKSRVRKCLDFMVEGSPCSHISPSTPGGRSCPIDVPDSDDDLNTANMLLPDDFSEGRGKTQCPGENGLNSNDGCAAAVEHWMDEKETNCYTERLMHLLTPKRRKVRRGVSYVLSSESENDSDDNIPICELKSKHSLAHTTERLSNWSCQNDSSTGDGPKELTPRRRLIRVGDLENKSTSGKCSHKITGSENDAGITATTNDTEDEIEEDDSSNEGESLGGFIVNSSNISESSSKSNCSDTPKTGNGSTSSDSSGDSNHSVEYDEIISGLRRERKQKMKWVSEGEMLADFGKCPELCMKAVCALYRQQTQDEKSFKAALHPNGRGFSQTHAYIGSALAEFLTDGDPQSDLKKTVEELKGFDAKGVEQCWKLATHYSKQLFEIYKNKEDPFFHP